MVPNAPKHFKPSLLGSWFIFFGIILGPLIIITERDNSGRIWPWLLLSLFFIGLLIHRLGLSYLLTDKELTVKSWWGKGKDEKISLAFLDLTEIKWSFSGRLTGRAHIYVGSSHFAENGLTLLSQPNPEKLCEIIETYAQKTKTSENGY